jgi:hypothetical protein
MARFAPARPFLLIAMACLAPASPARAAFTTTFYTDRAAFEAALVSSTAIDFEGLVAGNSHFTVPGSIVVDGVAFSVSSGFVGISGQNPGEANVVGAPFNTALLFSNNTAPVTANLTGVGSNFTAVGGTFGNVSAAGRAGTLTLTGTGGTLDVQSIVVGDMGLGAPPTFFGWTVIGESIVSVTYSLQDGHPHYEGIDDFVFGTAVPEPTSGLLVALGALGAMVARRFRRGFRGPGRGA